MELKIISSKKNVATDKAPFFSNNKMLYGDKAPESGDYNIGDFVISNTQENDIFGWVCTEAGNPGTWNVIGAGGEAKVMPYYNIVAFSDARTSIAIGIDGFNKDTDLLEVHYDGLLLVENVHYRISADGLSIEAVGDAWNKNADDNHEMAFRALRTNFEVQLPNSMIIRHKNTVTMTRDATEVRIGIAGFTQMKDILTVYKNSVYLIEGVDYDINADGTKIICRDGSWTADNGPNVFVFESLKNVQIMPENALVTMENLDDDVKAAIAAGGSGGGGDLSNYVTIDEMDTALADVGNSIQTIMTDHIWPMESNLQTKSDLTLRTTDKTVVGAINELFQSANDGKELIATAIGEPLNAEDTFSAMSTKINTLTTNFKSALLNKGVAVSGTDTIQSLITKIESITGGGGNTGSLVKTGELTISPTPKSFEFLAYFYEEGVKVPITEGTVTEEMPCWIIEADFVPIVIDVRNTISLEEEFVTYTFSYNGLTDPNAKMVCNMFLEGLVIESNLIIEGNKIYFPDIMLADIIENGGTPSDYNMITAYTIVGMGTVGDDPVLLESLKSVLQEEGITVNATDGMAELIAKVDSGFNNKNTEITTANNRIEELNTTMSGMVTPAGDAVAGNVLSGKTFINSTGQTITGTMTNRGGAQTITPGTSNKTLNSGYYSGNITIKGDANLKAANIKSGTSIFGVTGTYTGSSSTAFNTKSLSNSWYPSDGYVTKSFTSLGFGYTPAMIIVKGYVEYTDYDYDIETWSYFALVGVGGNGVMDSYQDFLYEGDTAYMFDLEITSYNSSTINIQASNGQFECVDYDYGEVRVRFEEVWYTPN